MTEWTVVFWSSARQIAEEAQLPKAQWPSEDVAPHAFFRTLRAQGEPMAALSYVGAALPKLEVIEWGLASLPPLDQADPDFAARMLLRDTAQRWLHEPDDENRRAVERLAEQADRAWPETIIGLAIFFSGGSIAPEDSPPISADPRLPGQLVSGAMLSAVAQRMREDPAYVERVLDLADRLASEGRKATAAS
jgi:hypothetical protein